MKSNIFTLAKAFATARVAMSAAVFAFPAAKGAEQTVDDVRGRGFVMPEIRMPHHRPSARSNVLRAAPSLPSFYDSRSNSWITAIRNQRSYGTCWAFATCAAMETSLVKSGQATLDIDISEKNLVNLTGLAGDHGIFGGNIYSPLGYLSRWQGAVDEPLDPYPTSGKTVATFGVSPELMPKYFIRKAVVLPERTDVTDNAQTKRALMEYGALMVNYYSGKENDVAGTSCITNADYFAQANHAVTLVGWDDSFEINGHTGAFIVKNSWGTSFGKSGYYHIAYDDVTFCTGMGAMAVVADTNTPCGASIVYQYDRTCYGGRQSNHYAGLRNGRLSGKGFNRYVASGAQELVAVGFYATVEDANYTISIRKTDGGQALLEQSGNLSEMGYHVIDLNAAVPLDEGDSFDVELDIDIPLTEYTVDGNTYAVFPLAAEALLDVSEAIEGESYAYNGNRRTWVNMQDDEQCNLVLKAFARPTATRKQALVANANATITNGAEFVTWANGSIATEMHGNTYGALADVVCANGRSLIDNWCLGLDPTNETSDVLANIAFTNGLPCITASPSSDHCEYSVKGRASLSGDDGWEDAKYDGTHRFFRIEIEPKTYR